MSLPCNKSWENWVPKNELIFDFRGQNEVEYNRITIFYYWLRFEKTPENKDIRHK